MSKCAVSSIKFTYGTCGKPVSSRYNKRRQCMRLSLHLLSMQPRTHAPTLQLRNRKKENGYMQRNIVYDNTRVDTQQEHEKKKEKWHKSHTERRMKVYVHLYAHAC